MKKWIVTLVLVTLLMFAMTGMANAWFEATAESTITGKTGYVRITTCNVTLTNRFQPGDTQYGLIKVRNAGVCPLKIVRIQIIGKPWFLAVSVTGPLNQSFRPGQTKTFRMYVKMPSGYTNPQNQFFMYKVRFYALNTPTHWPTPPQP